MDTTNSRLLPSRNNTRATRHANALPTTGMIIGLLSISMLAVSTQGSELDCANWENENFWKQATRLDVDNCLGQGVDFGNALYQAATFNTNPDIIKPLIEAEATVNARDESGWTPLHGAAWNNGTPDMIRTLIEAGASVSASADGGVTPLDLARASDNERAIRILMNHQ